MAKETMILVTISEQEIRDKILLMEKAILILVLVLETLRKEETTFVLIVKSLVIVWKDVLKFMGIYQTSKVSRIKRWLQSLLTMIRQMLTLKILPLFQLLSINN